MYKRQQGNSRLTCCIAKFSRQGPSNIKNKISRWYHLWTKTLLLLMRTQLTKIIILIEKMALLVLQLIEKIVKVMLMK